jgi:glyoxylase-like metal-dependent hydrolase (beta-lactamase superfamily II)
MKTPDIITVGKNNGEGMVINYKTSRGTDIFGLAVPNIYGHSDWDLGPTWCYLIAGQKTTLIDTGRLGNFEVFTSLLRPTGKKLADIDRVIISHSHEDHDGNVTEILREAQAELVAHELYQSMISYHRDETEGVAHPEFPGSCRLCRMPEKFYSSCLSYHRNRSSLRVDLPVEDGQILPDDLSFVFTPGHTPDSICIILEEEVIFTGDTVLPGITAQPTMAQMFKLNQKILPEKYRETNSVYGLLNFIKSLSKVLRVSPDPFESTFPAHRLFYDGKYNLIDGGRRAKDIIQFHIERCRDILKIVEEHPIAVDEIVVKHFPPSRLSDMGRSLADNEIRAHLEIMRDCGDIIWQPGIKDVVEPTGTSNCLDALASYLRSD